MQKLLVAEGVSFKCDGDVLMIVGTMGEHRLRVGAEVACRVALLAEQVCGIDELGSGLLNARNGMKQLAVLMNAVRNLISAGFISEVVELDGMVVAKLEKKGRLPWCEEDIPNDAVISPHLVVVRDGEWLVFDSGLGCGLVKIIPALAGCVLGGEEMAPGERLAPLREMLWRAGLLVSASAEIDLEHMMWNPVELLMMERSNDAAANCRYGATYRYHGQYPPPPLVEQIQVEEFVELPDPDLDRWFREDEPFGVITERRRSTSSFSETAAPTLSQVTNILHRSARIQRRFHDDKGMEISLRPVAAGGALHELDLYLAVDRLDGLDQGLWRYNPIANSLERVHCFMEPSALVDATTATVWGNARPPVTIIVVARFSRVLWKYEGVGASLVLKNVGVLLHALQLAAIVEGLGACVLGGNSAQLFEQVTGLGFPSHGPVGQLILGVGKEEQ